MSRKFLTVENRTDNKKNIVAQKEDNSSEPCINIKSSSSSSPSCSKRIVKFLLNSGADVNTKDKDGKTAFDLALDQDIKQMLQGKMNPDPLKSALTALKAKLAALASELKKLVTK